MDSCFFILTFSHFFFPLAPRRLCLRSCGTFLNTSCSLSLHNWNSAFKFKWLITHSDSYRKVCNRYQSLYTWQPRWEEILYQLREVQSGRAVYLRKFSFQGQEVDKSVGGAWVMREECLYPNKWPGAVQRDVHAVVTCMWYACIWPSVTCQEYGPQCGDVKLVGRSRSETSGSWLDSQGHQPRKRLLQFLSSLNLLN